MQEVLFSYIQFLILQISTHTLEFLLVFLGVPVVWLILKLTNILYEDRAISLASIVFALCSVISVIMFFTNSSPSDYYKPLLFLLAGIMTFLCVSPIYLESQPFEINNRKKYFALDGYTFPVALVTQVSVRRCFKRTSPSCKMEIFLSEEGQRARSLYYETNDVKKFREVVDWLKKYTKIEYDSSFTQATIENPFFTFIFSMVMLSLLVFCFVIPASVDLNQKRNSRALPEYKMLTLPKEIKESLKKSSLIIDPFKDVFTKQGIQIIVFDGAHSSHFVGNLRKELYSYPDQSYDYNIVFVTPKGISLKTALSGKVALSSSPQNVYTKYVVDNCNKFCLLDNELGVFYRTNLETIDPRIGNVQDAINMLTYASEKRLDARKKVIASKQAELERKAIEDEEYEDEY